MHEWVKISAYDEVTGPTVELTVLAVKPMQQHVTATDAAGFLQQLDAKGSVAVYGINFHTGKAALTADSAKVLGEVLKLLRDNPKLELLIEGHTDNVGGLRANLELSRKRADAVKDWLVKNGCDARRLVTNGVADRMPVAPNDSEEGRFKNRRVELVKL